MFKQRIRRFIEDKSLFAKQDRILIALSGGADSVALLRVMHSLGYECVCAHCNFHLRGEESDRDEAFVTALCKGLKISLHVAHFNTQAYAQERHISIEMAARELRYTWFESLREELGAKYIAVAHHRDDSVETLLLNLIRGTGINGLKGIDSKKGYIVRPLLQENRKSIEEYLKVIKQDFVTDSTNLQDEYMRNKIRLNLLPMMQELNPSIHETLARTSERLAEAASIYQEDRKRVVQQKLIKTSGDSCYVLIEDICKDVAPASLLHEIMSPLGFNGTQERDVMKSLQSEQSGKRFLAKDWEAVRDRDKLILYKRHEEESLPELMIEDVDISSSFIIPHDKHLACVDAEKVSGQLTIRKWRTGDTFVPLGMKGKKKVSDYLTDRKFTLFEKESQCVVCDDENIVWVVNERGDNRYRITEKTRKVLILSIKKDGE